LPDRFLPALGPEMKMDVHWIDIVLHTGQRFDNYVVRGGRFITGRADDPEGEGTLPFHGEEIAAIRRHRTFPWPFGGWRR
jgi:hypothetical protein